MRINIDDTEVSDEMVCRFVEGTSIPEEDQAILAKMSADREFACEVKDLMDALEDLSKMDEKEWATEKEYPYASAAFASFAKEGMGNEELLFGGVSKSVDDSADDFLDSYDEAEEDGKEHK